MRRWLTLAVLLVVGACGSTSTAASVPTPETSASAQGQPSVPALESPSPGAGGRSPSPSPSPVPAISCQSRSAGSAMFMTAGAFGSSHAIYDVSDPLRPRLICTIDNTAAHLFTGDTFVYLKVAGPDETDVMLHSIGSGNESKAASFPADVSDPFTHMIYDEAWTPDGSLLAFAVPDESTYTVKVFVIAQGKKSLVHTYGLGIGDCICRFGLPHPVLAFSPDGQYLVDGQLAGKGSTPITVIRVSDGSVVLSASPSVYAAIWGGGGDQLFLVGDASYSWTPGGGISKLPGNTWSYLQGISPDDTQVAYTAYLDPGTQQQPRVYVYDIKAGTARTLIDKPRTQVLFVKDGWVWYLEERACAEGDQCLGGTVPTGKVFAMQLSTGTEQQVTFPGSPLAGGWMTFAPGEFWPNS